MHKKIILLCLGDVIQASGKYCDLKKKEKKPKQAIYPNGTKHHTL